MLEEVQASTAEIRVAPGLAVPGAVALVAVRASVREPALLSRVVAAARPIPMTFYQPAQFYEPAQERTGTGWRGRLALEAEAGEETGGELLHPDQ